MHLLTLARSLSVPFELVGDGDIDLLWDVGDWSRKCHILEDYGN